MKYLKIGPYGLGALVIILGAALLRILLLTRGWPVLDSDEGTMGLMAMHIAYRGEHPTFFYGQNYMGSLEAFLGALLFQVIGPSLFALRLGLVLLFVLFLWSMYLLVSLLYTRKFALFSLFLLALGSSTVLKRELAAIGGYSETLLFGSLLLLLACWLALTARQGVSTRNRVRRALVYALWGLVVGVGLWSDPLVLPFVLCSALLLVFCRADLHILPLLTLLCGLTIGAFPLIVYNMAHPAQNSLGVLLDLHRGATVNGVSLDISWQRTWLGTLLVALPLATNAFPICSVTSRPLSNLWGIDPSPSGTFGLHSLPCELYQGVWGGGFVVLLCVALLLYGLAAWRLFRQRTRENGERREFVRVVARMSMLGCAALTLFVYVGSPFAELYPWTSYRYLLPLLITLPAVIWPLWGGIGTIGQGRTYNLRRFMLPFFRWGILVLIGLAFVGALTETFSEVPGAQVIDQQGQDLESNLLHLNATRIYADYWTCDRLMFLAHERILCTVLDDNLLPGLDRYLPYRFMVKVDPFPPYVFPLNSRQARAFARYIKIWHREKVYARHVFDGYVVYIRIIR